MKEYLQKIKDSFVRIWEFLRETRKEMYNVSWPGRRELTGTTLVVIVAVFFFGVFLYLVDMAVNYGMNFVFHRALQ